MAKKFCIYVVVHAFTLYYGFEVRDRKPFDPDNDDGNGEGFETSSNVKMHDGRIAEFMHCGGDGPCCSISKVVDQDVL